MSAALPLPDHLRHRLRPARALARRAAETTAPWTTTVDALDDLLRGGLRRGTVVELIGRRSSGRFSLVMAALAAVTGRGENAALVDLGDGFDPRTAQQAGMALDRLLWTRPRTIREALACTESILACGMPVTVVDLGLPPVVGGRGNEAAWLRLARAARAREAALLIASPYRASGTAADVVLHAQGRRATWRPWPRPDAMPCLLHGIDARLDLRKSRGRRPGAHARYTFDLEAKVSDEASVEPAMPAAPPAAIATSTRQAASASRDRRARLSIVA